MVAFYVILLDKYKCFRSVLFYASKKPRLNARNDFLNMFMLYEQCLKLARNLVHFNSWRWRI